MLEYNKRKFDISNIKGQPKIIEVNPPYEIPKKIFKYYPLNENSVNSLITHHIYASTYDDLNDILDAIPHRLLLNSWEFEHFWEIQKNGIPKPNLDEEYKRFTENEVQYRAIFRNTLYKILLPYWGFFCATVNASNDLMWAHYTSNSGMMIEYDILTFPAHFGKPFKMNYMEDLTPINPDPKDISVAIHLNALIKKKIWDYEDEYRFIITTYNGFPFETSGVYGNQEFKYEKESRIIPIEQKAITKIVLGFNFFKNYLDTVIESHHFTLSGQDGILRSKVLDYSIDYNTPIELMVLDTNNFKFIPKLVKFHRYGFGEYSFELL